MTDQVETTDVSMADFTLEAAVEDVQAAPPSFAGGLPGLAITKYVLHDIKENGWHTMAEPYLFGIAVDSTLKPVKIPWGLESTVDPAKFALPKVAAEVDVTFGNTDGAPLVLPPVQDFLALVLMVADSDNAKATAEVLKAVSSLATNADLLKVAAGVNPTAAAVLAVVGGILDVTVKGIENNRDDIIAVFSAYFGPSKLTPGGSYHLTQPGAEVWLRVMDE